MSDHADRFGPPIDLADETDFQLGALLVSPSTRDVGRGELREMLEPRVMQVLVALFQANGQVVSRDELIARCWDGRIVGEDAINRAIGRLRRLSEVDLEASFAVETIPRVGYRLMATEPGRSVPIAPVVVGDATPSPLHPLLGATQPSIVMRHRLAIAAAVAIVLTTTTWLLWPAVHPSQYNASAGPGSPMPDPTRVTIAVLPFLNLASEKDQEFFSDGMTEELTSALAKVPGLTVIGRTSAFQFKGENRDLRAIGKALGVKNLIEGSVRKDGDKVRISAQLVRVADGADLWTESYDRKLTGIFAVQEDIATAIAGALQVPLGLKQGQNLVSNRTTDTESYEAYLRAKELVRARGAENLASAITLLEQVNVRDPNYAPAWALAARAYGLLPGYQLMNFATADELRQASDSGLIKAEAAARKAISLDANNSDAWAALGSAAGQRKNLIQAEDDFKRALTLDPKNVEALHAFAHDLSGTGRLKEALALRRQTVVLDPLDTRIKGDLAYVLALNGRYDEALATTNTFLPNVAAVKSAVGRFKEAADALLRIPPGSYPAGIVETAARALRAAPTQMASPQDLPAFPVTLNFVYLYVGAASRALEFSEAQVKTRFMSLGTDPLWFPAAAPLRRTERFKALMRNGGIVDYWRARGWPDLCHPVGAEDFACN
jgi:TolB-like protein/DNA-binding winged helix-turn-helix (wHTH) protein/cytochrome c-type biogenesis protein CcmH/NrfG